MTELSSQLGFAVVELRSRQITLIRRQFEPPCTTYYSTVMKLNEKGYLDVQGWAQFPLPGWVNFVPAVAYHFCLNLPAPFTRPGNSNFAQPCIRNVRYPAPGSVTRERGRDEGLARECGALLSGLSLLAGSQSSRMPAPFAAGWVYLHRTL